MERLSWVLTASAPVALAANVLIQTRFQVEPALIIARATPLSAFVQTGLVWVFIGITAIIALALATAGAAFFRTARPALGLLACIAGCPFLIPYFMQLYNQGSMLAFIAPCFYIAYCFARPQWWPPLEGDIFRWVLPVSAIFGTLVPIVVTPLQQVSVTYQTRQYRAQIVKTEDGGVLLYDQARVAFYSYPASELTRTTPCFVTFDLGELGWLPAPQAPQPQCPELRLPVKP